MTYTQQTWHDGAPGGTPVSADRLTHMEAGIAAADTAAASALSAVGAVNAASVGLGSVGNYLQQPYSAKLVEIASLAAPSDSTVLFHDAGHWSTLSMAGLAAALGPADVLVNVASFGAAGDGITNDAAAIQAAINAIPASGGTLYFPPGDYICGSGWTLTDRRSIRVLGAGNPTGGATAASMIRFTQTSGSRIIDARGAVGVTFEHLWILQAGAGFTGHVIDFSHSGTALDGSMCAVSHCFMDAVASPASLINLAQTHTMTVERCNLVHGVCAIMGGGAAFANQIRVQGNIFQLQATAPIVSAQGTGGQTWTVIGNTFEPRADGAAAAIYATTDLLGLVFVGNWTGDASASGTWISANALQGCHIGGNFFASGAKGIVCTGAVNNSGNIISGNTFSGITTALDISAASTWQGDFALNFFYSVATPLVGTPTAGRYQTGTGTQMNYSGSQVFSTAVANGIGTTLSGVMWGVNTGAAGSVGVAVKGAASQSADLQQWRDSSDTVLGRVRPTGSVEVPTVVADSMYPVMLSHTGTLLGFYNHAPVTKPAVSGSRGGNAALASLLSALASLGLITDSSSA